MREQLELVPKPMLDTAAHPIVWHVVSIYAARARGDSGSSSIRRHERTFLARPPTG